MKERYVGRWRGVDEEKMDVSGLRPERQAEPISGL
jgi:hypothetical protein